MAEGGDDKMAKMPVFVSDFISILRDEEAKELWEWLDGNPEAEGEMIEHIAKTHKKLARKLEGDPSKLAKKAV